ncbi:type II secretion system protein GspK [Ferrovibrio sp.]|uniref:type II secretion system protein GspK n=1 Tax=Ferrovibrio sp. TaxID=1917215 RepID=UPI0025BE5BBF|nr:type II secretion system protein GspK [Ferrovibrio sp.]MBX3456030.1 general secretion pathway protein GspK [Ferrovibrio sp.]
MKPGPTKTPNGFALIAVLFGLALLAGATLLLSERGVTEAHGTANIVQRARLNQAMEAGLALGLDGLLREQRRIAPLEIDGFIVSVRIAESTSLLDLNTAGQAEILRLLRDGGLPAGSADAAASALADWIDSDGSQRPNGAEAPAYRAAGKPYGPRNAPMESLSELPLILHMPPDAARLLLRQGIVQSALAGLDVVDVTVQPQDQSAGIAASRRRHVISAQPTGKHSWQIMAQYDLPS